MNDQSNIEDGKLSKEEYINGAWIDVKLCTVRAIMLRQNLADKKDKEAILRDSIVSTLYYNELHYGNYE